MTAIAFGGFQPDKPIPTDDIEATDFTIVVRMDNQRQGDQFYVVPTAVAWKEIRERQRAKCAKKGAKDIGMFRLSFAPRRDGQEEAGTDIERKWREYLGRWDLLDG